MQRARHTSRPRAATVGKGVLGINSVVRSIQASAPALIKNIELVALVRRKQFRYLFQALRQSGRRQQRVVTLAQLVIIQVKAERKQVNGNRVTKRSGQIN